jgi:phosphoribosylglycinamide formyltransferase-1
MNVEKLKLGFLASHQGTNMQAIIDACNEGRLHAEPRTVICNNSRCGAVARARREGIATHHLSNRIHPDPDALDRTILETLQDCGVEVLVLAGYMKKLGSKTLAAYRGRILNIHPALLPKFGGKGFYGDAVHQAVLAAGATESGATVHLVDGEYDQGTILAQRKVAVLPDDTPETLAARVLEQEHVLYAETLQKIAMGEIVLES